MMNAITQRSAYHHENTTLFDTDHQTMYYSAPNVVILNSRKLLPVYRDSFYCSAMLTTQHYHWYAATWFAFCGGYLAEWTTTGNGLNRSVNTTPVISACWRLMLYDVKNSSAIYELDPNKNKQTNKQTNLLEVYNTDYCQRIPTS